MSRKRHPVWRTLSIMAGDLAAIGVALYGAYWLRFTSGLMAAPKGVNPEIYLDILPCAWVLWFILLRFENLYRRRSPVLNFNVIRRIVTGSALALLTLIALNFFFRFGPSDDYSRSLLLILLVTVILALIASRVGLHFHFRRLMIRRGIGLSRTIVLGSGPLAAHVCRTIQQHPECGMQVVGIILGRRSQIADCGLRIADSNPQSGIPNPQSSIPNPQSPIPNAQSPWALPPDVPVLGTVAHLSALLVEHRADHVILAQHELEREIIPSLLVQCERAMAEFMIVPETTELLLSGMTAEMLDGIPLLGIRQTPLQGWNAALKRLIDFGAASVGLCAAAPLLGVLTWLVRRQDGGPAFYLQERMGIDGRLFKMIKLRTMRPNAEATGPAFAAEGDPRCTPLGRVLRRWHLDELPQLINVLCGEMSLVGPRPERPYFVQQFRDNVPRYMARHKVKSGITGWAQVNGLCGPHGSIDERLKYDLYYIENWSLALDLKILFLTLFNRIKPGPAEG